MNEDNTKNKLKMQDIINEIDNLRKYNSELFNSVKGDKLENYLRALDKSIIKAQNMAEIIYTKDLK